MICLNNCPHLHPTRWEKLQVQPHKHIKSRDEMGRDKKGRTKDGGGGDGGNGSLHKVKLNIPSSVSSSGSCLCFH